MGTPDPESLSTPRTEHAEHSRLLDPEHQVNVETSAELQHRAEMSADLEPKSSSCRCWLLALALLGLLGLGGAAVYWFWRPQASEAIGVAEGEVSSVAGQVVLGAAAGAEVLDHAGREFLNATKQHSFWKPGVPAGKVLFCWGLIMAHSGEETLLRHHYDKMVNIFSCDSWLLLSDHPVKYQEVTSIPIGAFNSKWAAWGSWLNVPVFLRAWKAVLKNGQYKDFDWTVKMDMDTVFCPHRLRQFLVDHSCGACFWSNFPVDDKVPLDFLGPLEIFSKEAVKVYSQHRELCPRPHPQTQGEDAFMKDCMVKLAKFGVVNKRNYHLLRNSCDSCKPPLSTSECGDSLYSSFHPFKTVQRYSDCLANAGQDC